MALSVFASGTSTIGTTEFSLANGSTTLATKTNQGVYAVLIDANAFVAGDVFLVQVYEAGKPSTGTKRVIDSWTLEGPPGKPMLYIPSTGGLILGNGWDITIKKVAGTDRSIDYTIWQVA